MLHYICPGFDLQVAEFSVWKCEVLEKKKVPRAWLTAAHVTFSYFTPWSTVSHSGDQCFYLRGDKETSISSQLRPVTVWSVTLRWRVNWIPSPGARWDKSQTRCCGLRLSPSHPGLLTTLPHAHLSPRSCPPPPLAPYQDAMIVK